MKRKTKLARKKQRQEKRSRKTWIKRILKGPWGLSVRTRDGHKCRLCGNPANQPHHHFTRQACPSVQFEIDNGITLCASCHTFRPDPERVRNEIIRAIGQERYDELNLQAHTPHKFDDTEFAQIEIKLQSYLTSLTTSVM